MWELYDDLIALIPDDIVVSDFTAGVSWFTVTSGSGHVGMAMTPREGEKFFPHSGNVVGQPVKRVAQYVKSWNNYEAALGLAAINSVANDPEIVSRCTNTPGNENTDQNVFEYMRERIKGKKVAVIGHFRSLEKIAEECQLSILERFPLPGDFPDPACEYILPEQDYVFITGTTLINKTMPRLLQLSRKAFVTVAGPSTPLSPVMFRHGVDLLAGTVVTDAARVRTLIREGDQHRFFGDGAQMVRVSSSLGSR